MQQNQRRVAFKLTVPDAEELSMTSMVEKEVRGLMELTDDGLVLQFQEARTETSLSGLSVTAEASDVTELRVALDRLASAHIRGWWGRTVTLVSNDLTLFAGLPGAPGDRIVLKFRRRDRVAAQDLVTRLQFALSDLGMEHLDDHIRRLEGQDGEATGLPPGEGGAAEGREPG